MKNPVYYEKPPKRPNAFAWLAPEHWNAARNMQRVRGELVIEEHPIFIYSRLNPPAWLLDERQRAKEKRLAQK
jgi:hypothetical protein